MSTEALFTFRSTVDRMRQGPLGSYVDAYAARLQEQGYSEESTRTQIRCVADFSRWLKRRGIAADDVDDQALTRFLKYRQRHRHLTRSDASALQKLLALLRERHIARPMPVQRHLNPLARIERDFERYLTQERGRSRSTLLNYQLFIRQFLQERFQGGAIRLAALTAADVMEFVQRHARDYGVKRTKLMPTALRAFLRFLHLRGDIVCDLAAAVPTVACWSFATLPKFLARGDVQRVLTACRRDSRVGRRNYAILQLLARLGLRAGEIVTLTLEDIDWEAARIRLHSKCQRLDELPLPDPVGRAIAEYLRHGRPRCPDRRLFIRERAPIQGFANASAVSTVVRRALARAGIESTHKGAHVFRHTLATEMLAHGASLHEIGQLLRHQNPETTMIYAKVDVAALRHLAPPWPKEML